MKYKEPLEEGELHRMNIRSIRKWIEQNKGKIKAKPDKTALYSGRDYDLEVIKDLSDADREEFMGTPMWKVIEKIRKDMVDLKVPYEFQTLEDVLKSIRDYPTIVDLDRKELRFANAHECFSELKQLTKLLPNARGVSEDSWGRLSEGNGGNREASTKCNISRFAGSCFHLSLFALLTFVLGFARSARTFWLLHVLILERLHFQVILLSLLLALGCRLG
jgi:hypothetical protein